MFLETVGVGQAEVDVIDHADTIVLVLMPGSGDSIQALKAGVMEIPDIIVVNKADHPLTETMVREIRGVLSLAPQRGWRVPIVKTEAAARRGRRPSSSRSSTSTARYIEAEGTLTERRRRNLRNEVLAHLHRPHAPRASRRRSRGRASSQSCSTRSSRAGWTRPPPPRRSSSASSATESVVTQL